VRIVLSFLMAQLLAGCTTVWFDQETRDVINLLGATAAEYNKPAPKPLELECLDKGGGRSTCTQK